MSIQQQKHIQVTFSFVTCKCTFFELTKYGSSVKKSLNNDKYNFNLGFRLDLDQVRKMAVISINSTISEADNPKNELSKLDSLNEFSILNFDEAITKNQDGLLAIPDPILASMLSVSVSTLRGMYTIKLENTKFNNAVLPLVNPNDLIPKKPASVLA